MNKDVYLIRNAMEMQLQWREAVWQAFQVDLLLPGDTLSVCTEHCHCLCKIQLQRQVSV